MRGKHARPAPAWRPLAVAAVASLLLLSTGGVWAGLVATARNSTPQAVSTGTLALTMTKNGAGFDQEVAGLAPGDTVHRFVNLNNTGTLAAQQLSLSLASSAANLLTGTDAKSLRVSVEHCTTGWTSSFTCSTTPATLLGATPLGTVTAAPQVLVPGAVAATTSLRVTLSLPNVDEVTTNGVLPSGSIQGLSTSLTWTFSQSQRTGTTTSA